MHLTIDFETKSAADLPKVGAWRYAEHPSTDVYCMAMKVDDKPGWIWVSRNCHHLLPDFDVPDLRFTCAEEVLYLIEQADEIEAHNAQFERAIWHHVMLKKYGWPPLLLEKVRCSMAKAAMHGLPLSLDQAVKAMGLPIKKDMEGNALMLKWCKPKADGSWQSSPHEFVRILRYCVQDVETEHALSQALHDLPPQELALYHLDQKINERGFYVDSAAAKAAISTITEHERRQTALLVALTEGAVKSAKAPLAMRSWLESVGYPVKDLQAQTVEELLTQDDLPAKARRLLEIRQQLGKSSTAKYEAFLRMACDDSRVRGTMLYHGASTGRWAGRGPQPHNMPRGTEKLNTDDLINLAFQDLSGGPDLVELLYGDVMGLASSAVRGVISAAPGNELFCSDFSSVEARVNAWLAGQEDVLDSFAAGLDLYKVAAAQIFNVIYEAVDKHQRQTGKCSELALGYGGGIGAYASMASNYRVDLDTLPEHVFPVATPGELEKAREMADAYLKLKPGSMTHEAAAACDIIKQKWRASRQEIVAFWYALERAAKAAIQSPGTVFQAGHLSRIAFAVKDRWLLCRLPSGRCLFYTDPTVERRTHVTETGYERIRESIRYWTVDGYTRKWQRAYAYGGKLCENVVQAVARDLLAEALQRVECAGYPTVLHVHDELVAERPIGTGNLEEFNELVSTLPPWAEGLPLTADGWQGIHYRKD